MFNVMFQVKVLVHLIDNDLHIWKNVQCICKNIQRVFRQYSIYISEIFYTSRQPVQLHGLVLLICRHFYKHV